MMVFVILVFWDVHVYYIKVTIYNVRLPYVGSTDISLTTSSPNLYFG
jgi:hypothetical protein